MSGFKSEAEGQIIVFFRMVSVKIRIKAQTIFLGIFSSECRG